MVTAVWLKTHDVAEGDDWRAIKFTSFGSRPPTSAELAAFPVIPEDCPWVPALDDCLGCVVDGPGGVLYDVAGVALPLFTLTFLPQHIFDVPGEDTLAHLLALLDLTAPLYLVKDSVIQGIMVNDVFNDGWILTSEPCGLIVNSAEVHKFALQRLLLL